MTELKIPVEELSTVINKAILDSLSADTKERLIEGALKYLLTEPSQGRYGEKAPSPLQQAFNLALNQIAHEVALSVIESHGARQRLTDSFSSLIESVPDFDDDWTLQRYMLDAALKRAKEIRSDV